MRKAVRIGVLVAVIGVSGAAALYGARGDQREVTGLSAAADPSSGGGYTYERLDRSARTMVRDGTGAQLALFTDGAADRISENLRVGGDARFGPDSAEGRLEKSDFYDYLGIGWDFPGGVHEAADPARARSLDCSGFVRMVYGYRSGYPLPATNGHRRVLSSRKVANGPTFGDAGGVSLIDGSGTYAKAFRAAKRL